MQKHQGLSLIEILISLFLLSLMLLGLDAMGLVALRETKSTYYFAVATQQINNMIEQLYAAKNADMTQQIKEWNMQNDIVLPQGVGEVSGEYPNYRVSIVWGNFSSHACNKNQLGASGCLQTIVKL